jgi:diguanylate cyclase (GGDEF)-like protein/PAS domain S-box-containing protein
MKYKKKTKEQLITELVELHQRIADLEASEVERKLIEKEIRESKARYKAFFDRTLYCVYVHDFEGRFLDANDTALNLLGYKREDILFVNFSTLLEEDQLAVAFKNMEELLQTGSQKRPNEYKLRKKDGGYVWVEAEASVIYRKGKPYAIQGIARDITDHKRAEDALRESEERYRAIVESSIDGIVIVQGLIIMFVNEALYKMFGYQSADEIKGHEFREFVAPEYKDLMVERGLLREGGVEVPSQYEFKALRKDGTQFDAELSVTAIIYRGNVARQGIIRNVSERKRTEKALLESEERYRNIFEDSREAIYVSSREGKFIDVNQSTLDLFGYSREEMIGMNVLDIYVNPADRDKFQQEIEQKGSVKNYDVKFYRKNGTEMDCLLTSTVWKAIDGTVFGYQGIIRDITETKKVADQLRYLSLHDHLTGLYNRAYFEEEMHRLESGRYDSAGIIMCDVDGLKLVNDALGHHTGDNLLIATANVLKQSFRESDVIARVGGDEFAVLVANTDSNAIEKACQRIQDTAVKYNSANPTLPLSVSLGFAVSTGTPIIMGNLFKEADNNMYREKLQHSLIARSTIVQILMKALETRDFKTKGHVDRLQKLVIALALAAGLPDHRVTDLRLLAEFHDIGKVGIPEHILFKPCSFTPEEIIEIQKHCEIGHRIAMYTPDLIPIADLILKHHEWWNGEGYPLGIKGEEIPLECRILSICDTYENMTSDRPYYKATSHEEALAELTRRSGTKFDPDLVSKFIQVLKSTRN